MYLNSKNSLFASVKDTFGLLKPLVLLLIIFLFMQDSRRLFPNLNDSIKDTYILTFNLQHELDSIKPTFPILQLNSVLRSWQCTTV